MKTLLCGADVIAYDNTFSLIKNAYVGINGEIIDYIGTEKPSSYDIEKDMRGKLLIPGLYNCHTHSSMGLLRGLGSDLPLDRWLTEAMFPIEDKLTKDDISVGTRLAMLEMLACGTVSFSDMYFITGTTAEEVIASGMKANLNRPIQGFDDTELYENNFRVIESRAFFHNYNGLANGRIIADFSIHGEYTSFDELVKPYADECKRCGARMHIHLSETKKEFEECKARHNGKTPTEWFEFLGVFDNPTSAAHCIYLTDTDMEILKAHDVSCVHNPTSNLKLASGFMPLNKLLKNKINVALGTDGAASNNNLNMFEEMHLASIIHKGYEQDPTVISPETVLKMASVNGAISQGRKNCGFIAVGNKADIVAIDLDKPHLMPNHDYFALLSYSVQASDVVMTMVDGNILYENGEYKTIDIDKVKFDVNKAIKHLVG